MWSGHGDQNIENTLKLYQGVKQKIFFKNIKMSKFRVILTCDKRYETYDLKRKVKHYIIDLIF